jgi:hypothetical protein
VVDTLTRPVKLSDWEIEKTLAEKDSQQDMLRGAVLLLASSTWNTGGRRCYSKTRPRILAWPLNPAHALVSATIDISRDFDEDVRDHVRAVANAR